MFAGKRKDAPKDYHFYDPGDPAFDVEAEAFNYDLWIDTGDMAHLPLRQGMQPWRFTLRRLSSAEKAWIRDMAAQGGNTALWWAVALSLRSVRNPAGEEEGVERQYLRNWQVADEEWMAALEQHQELFAAMAGYVVAKEITPNPK